MKYKTGDTLIEVMLAVGIFSMVAIAVVAVMSGGVSSSQTALETTIAREEIDAQAEAIRFIQSSYVADKNSGDDRYSTLWKRLTDDALTETQLASTEALDFSPSSCSELYDKTATNGIVAQKAFIIDTRKLGSFTTAEASKVVISASDDPDRFTQTLTYPRLLFGNSSSQNEDSSQLADDQQYTSLYRAEGIYVVAVKDNSTTTVFGDMGSEQKSAFYDFYIRTCWYGSGADHPSTISTVIRLYDPDSL